MTGRKEQILGLLSSKAEDFHSLLSGLGWRVETYDADRGAPAQLLFVDARNGENPLAVLGEQGVGLGGVAVSDLQTAYQALIRAGVTHFIPWPCDESLLTATLDMASALGEQINDQGMALNGASVTPDQDGLTGLMSRSAARQWLDQKLGAQPDSGDEVSTAACLLIGISQFASINAAYGKAVGDAVLARAAGRIVRSVEQLEGEGAIAARMGGTEFLIAVPDGISEKELEELGRLILSNVSRPFVAGDQVIRLTARCGLAKSVEGDDASSLLRRVSAALADARRSNTSDVSVRSGRGRQGGKAQGSETDRLDADLRLALDRGDIGIVYQPQYDSFTDKIVGVEALARWNHPKLGQLDAGTLFDAADRSDYLLPLSLHIQKAALEEAGKWPAKLNGLRLSINVTAADLAQEDFVTLLLDMVDQSGFPRHRLTVEITESGLIENIDRAADMLRELRQEGLWVAIDDFGTGYSSLAYLKSLHPDYLKIDHSLSRDILGTPRDRIILRAIIAMARSLALTVITEGVESEQQLTLLAREGCDIYQGFLRSPPVTSEELAELVVQGG